MPTIGKNFNMIMECGAERPEAGLFVFAALSSDTACDYYDMISPDGHALYDAQGTTGWTPRGSYIDRVRKPTRF